MSENLGTIYWQVDADTDGAINSEKALSSQTKKVEADFKSLDAQTTKTSKAVKTGIAGMGRKAGQAGIQMQQFIGQIQGGQNAMLALSAQSADLGFVLGAPLLGAVAGIAASLVGILMPALFGSAEETKKLNEEITELVKSSKLTEAQSAFLVSQTEDEIKAKQKLLEEAKKDVKSKEEQLVAYNKLTDAQKKRQGGTANEKDFTKDLLAQKASVDTLTGSITSLEKKKAQYTLATKKSLDEQEEEEKTVKKVTTALESYGEKLEQQVEMLGMSDRGMSHYKATMIGATDEMHAQIDAIYDHKKAMEEDDAFAKDIAARQKAAAKEQATEKKTAVTYTESIIDKGETPQDQVDKLAEYRAKDLISAQQHEDALTQIKKDGEAARYQTMQLGVSAASTLFSSIAELISASGSEQSTAYKVAFATAKGFAVANASLNFSSAVMTAFNDPTAITLPQKIANIATATTAGAGLLSAVTSASYSGREHGGGVNAGQTYEVGEKNKPEMLMIPGNNGKVFSNAEMKGMMNGGGGGGTINQTINNHGSADGYEVRSRGDGVTTPQVIDIIRSQMGNANSVSRRAQASTSNVTNTIRSRR